MLPLNRSFPIRDSGQTPAFQSGAYILFHRGPLETRLPPGLYLNEGIEEDGSSDGRALHGRSDREIRLTGLFRQHENQFENRNR